MKRKDRYLLSSYIERALSHGCSSIDSSQVTRSPEHWWQVTIPCWPKGQRKEGKP